MNLLVIDGNSIANRAYYGIRPLSNKKGVFTHAIMGFFNIYFKLVKQFEPEYIAVAFDLRAPTFRTAKYAEYKAGRKGMPEDLAMQMPYIKEILKLMGVSVLEKEGFEADDILGTLARVSEENGKTCVLATGDRDSFQLITDKVFVNLAKTSEDILYTPEKIRETYGLEPVQMIEVKALMGDPSDNIPGVPGIGEKTALSLIQKYESIDNLYNNVHSAKLTDSVRKKLIDNKDLCYISRELGTICKEVPISNSINDYLISGADNDKLSALLTELEVFSLLKKLDLSAVKNTEVIEPTLSEMQLIPEFVFIFEQSEKIFFFKTENDITELNDDNYNEILSSDEEKCIFDVKSIWNTIYNKGVEIKNIAFDIVLASYLLDVNRSVFTIEKLCSDNGIDYNEESAAVSLKQLCGVLYSKINKENLASVLTNIEIPLSEVLVSMEHEGICLNADGVRSFGAELEADINRLENNIYELAECQFNIASPKQLGEVLFDKLCLPYSKKTKTGYSTNAEVLDFLMDKHEIIPLISEYRTLTKLNSTYVSGLLKLVASDGRLHTTFRQTETRTGRISSVEPNIQNIPVRTKRGRIMRSFFTAGNGKKLVDGDYSQIELRVLAHISNDEIMKNAFINGDDIHTITASQVLGVPVENITAEMRSSAKAVNFGIVYGIGAFSLSKDIGVSVAEADIYIKNYLKKYSSVDKYMQKTITEAKINGYVTTMFDRKRYIPEIKAVNKNIEALGKRMAMNTPIQGTAADIIKLAMIEVYNELKKSGLNARLILQVHDELIVEADEKDTLAAQELLKRSMENAVKLSIPLTADVKSGDNWFETH